MNVDDSSGDSEQVSDRDRVAVTADAVALEARRIADHEPRSIVDLSDLTDRPVVSLTERRLAQLPKDSRRLPSVTKYDQLLRLRPTAPSEEVPKRVDDRRLDVQVGVEVELAQRFLTRERDGFDAPLGVAPVAVVAFAHQQFGEEPAVGHLLARGLVGQIRELARPAAGSR